MSASQKQPFSASELIGPGVEGDVARSTGRGFTDSMKVENARSARAFTTGGSRIFDVYLRPESVLYYNLVFTNSADHFTIPKEYASKYDVYRHAAPAGTQRIDVEWDTTAPAWRSFEIVM